MQLVEISDITVGAETNSVNVRKLHNFLNNKQQFSDYIKNRISKYGFVENQDYIKTSRKVGNATAYDYHITLDMAKELCMVENNDKGREARRYFIECEKQLKQPKTEQYELLQQTILAQNAMIAQMQKQTQTNAYPFIHNNLLEIQTALSHIDIDRLESTVRFLKSTKKWVNEIAPSLIECKRLNRNREEIIYQERS